MAATGRPACVQGPRWISVHSGMGRVCARLSRSGIGTTIHVARPLPSRRGRDRKSTRLNSSHLVISYAVFCLKKKKKRYNEIQAKNNVLTEIRDAPVIEME